MMSRPFFNLASLIVLSGLLFHAVFARASDPIDASQGLPAEAAHQWLHQAASFERADFNQRREIKALDQPLRSSGTVTLTSSGFVWEQRHPFRNSLSYDGETISETTWIGDDAITRPLLDPVSNNMTSTLFEMMTGSWDRLLENFYIESENRTANKAWSVHLIPRDDQVRGVITGISISGDRFIEEIDVRQADGSTTVIELSNQRQNP